MAYHLHIAESPWDIQFNSETGNSHHEMVSDTISLHVFLDVNNSFIVHTSDKTGLTSAQFLNPSSSVHLQVTESPALFQPIDARSSYIWQLADTVSFPLYLQRVVDFSSDRYNNRWISLEFSNDHFGNFLTPKNYVASEYGSTPLAISYSNDFYGQKEGIRNYSVDSYARLTITQKVEESLYSLLTFVNKQSSDKYSLIDGSIIKEFSSDLYNISQNTSVFENSLDYYILQNGESLSQNLDVTFTLDGELLPISSISSVRIYYGIDQFCASVDVTLNDLTVFNKCKHRSILVVDTSLDVFTFIVDTRTKNRSIGSVSMTVTGTSLTADLGQPYATPITKIFDSNLASEIAKELAVPFTLDWNTIDWIVPVNTLSVVDQSPIDIIKLLAATCGAVVLTTPDNILKVVPKYPINPSSWRNSSADLLISDELDIITQDESDDVRSGFNKVRISNQSMIDNQTASLDEISISDTVKQLKLYTVPFTTLFNVVTSGGYWVSINNYGVKTETLTEVIEFVNGVGKTSKPIYSITNYVWNQKSLGTLTFKEDGSVTSTVAEHSLLSITYVTKYVLYEVSDSKIEQVQFYVE